MVPNGASGFSGFFLQTTLLELITEGGASTNARIILDNTRSYYYIAGVWRNALRSQPLPGGVNQTNADAATLAQMITISAAMFGSSLPLIPTLAVA